MIETDSIPKWRGGTVRRFYERLPSADDVSRWRHRYILPFRNLRIPIAFLSGSTRANGRPGTLLVAGDERRIGYMSRLFFEGETRREELGETPLWNLARTLKRLRALADLTVAHVDQLSARLLFGADYLAVPEWVGTVLTIPEDFSELTRGNESLKNDLRIIRRNNLTSEISHKDSDFEMFYHTMYVPSVCNRYEELAVIRDFDRMYRVFRQGGIQWIRYDGKCIAGRVFQLQGQTFKFVIQGTVNGEQSPVKQGAIAALYFFGIDYAKALGCKTIELGGSRPSLNDGVLRYKRKWGANLIEQNDAYYDFLVYWNDLSRPVISFLSNAPLIFRDHDGLSAISAIDSDRRATKTEAEKIHNYLWMPGLRRLYLVSTSGWQPGISSPPQTRLVDATNTESCNPGTLR